MTILAFAICDPVQWFCLGLEVLASFICLQLCGFVSAVKAWYSGERVPLQNFVDPVVKSLCRAPSLLHVRHGRLLGLLGAAAFPARFVGSSSVSGICQQIWRKRRRLLSRRLLRFNRGAVEVRSPDDEQFDAVHVVPMVAPFGDCVHDAVLDVHNDVCGDLLRGGAGGSAAIRRRRAEQKSLLHGLAGCFFTIGCFRE